MRKLRTLQNFQKGDKVKCMEGTFSTGKLEKGKIYTVRKKVMGNIGITLEEIGLPDEGIAWSTNRFELVNKDITIFKKTVLNTQKDEQKGKM